MKLQKEWIFTHQCKFKSHLFYYPALSLGKYLIWTLDLLNFLLRMKHLSDGIMKLSEYVCKVIYSMKSATFITNIPEIMALIFRFFISYLLFRFAFNHGKIYIR